ncbi:hypothetical protein DPMN_109548 [Dreissena polymorpha]|uniref:Uncharacterized protein n=1 Tax=Dreissena polymorpha TaxID=45954 RepID=A0A9D4KAV8_DREPO|nr:hypothetical protein DPMN_109548 [Dreissena polymorpha]
MGRLSPSNPHPKLVCLPLSNIQRPAMMWKGTITSATGHLSPSNPHSLYTCVPTFVNYPEASYDVEGNDHLSHGPPVPFQSTQLECVPTFVKHPEASYDVEGNDHLSHGPPVPFQSTQLELIGQLPETQSQT